MEIIAGKRKDSFLYVYEGFTYNVDKRYTYIYRCSKRRTLLCSGLLVKMEERYILKAKHNHSNEPYVIDIFKMK